MKTSALLLALGLGLLSGSCENTGEKINKMYTTKSGLKYTFKEIGKGRKPQNGEVVKVHYTGTLPDGTKFDSSHDRGTPISFKLGIGQVIKGWDEAISLMPIGSKASLIIPPDLAYGDRDLGTIKPNSTLHFDVELVDIVAPPKPFEVTGKDTIHLESGLKYIKVSTASAGKEAEAFRTVSVHYTGFLPDGKIFDSSVERGMPFSFTIGKEQVIKGWDEGISKLKVGEKARLIVPPHLGYGERGYPPVIPANSTLIFDVELISVN